MSVHLTEKNWRWWIAFGVFVSDFAFEICCYIAKVCQPSVMECYEDRSGLDWTAVLLNIIRNHLVQP